MREIIGNTTSTPNPRPDWNQTDETKADYIKNKPDIEKLIGGGSGGNITVDSELSSTSTNPVQNKVVTEAFKDYVKNTDYAEEYDSSTDSGKYGIVRPANGLRIDNRNNLTTDRTTTGVNNSQYVWVKDKFIEEINKGNSNTAVTVGTLGVAVKAALLNPGNFKAAGAQGNYPTMWTKDEQELAQKTLGITNGGGGDLTNYYTKSEVDNKFDENCNVDAFDLDFFNSIYKGEKL